jgi:hypothetical protein
LQKKNVHNSYLFGIPVRAQNIAKNNSNAPCHLFILEKFLPFQLLKEYVAAVKPRFQPTYFLKYYAFVTAHQLRWLLDGFWIVELRISVHCFESMATLHITSTRDGEIQRGMVRRTQCPQRQD